MIDPRSTSNVELKGISRGRDGQWISNIIRPRDWSIVVAASYCEVLVIDKIAARESFTGHAVGRGQSGSVEFGDDFVHGYLWITAGKKVDARMEWTEVRRPTLEDSLGGRQRQQMRDSPRINRPTSYQVSSSIQVLL